MWGFQNGLTFEISTSDSRDIPFYVPRKMSIFWKGLAVVFVVCDGTKMVILGGQII